jgi:hypothetical protein
MTNLLFLVFAFVCWTGSAEDHLRHRKLLQVPDEDVMPEEYLVVFSPKTKKLNSKISKIMKGHGKVDFASDNFSVAAVSGVKKSVLKQILKDQDVVYVEPVRRCARCKE